MSNSATESHRPPAPPEHLYDAIVVGTGFGGAVAACRLAQRGLNVLVLERGRRYEASDFPGQDDFPASPEAPALLPDLRRWTWAAHQGLWDILDLEEVISVQAAGYGGGSLIYANVHLRPLAYQAPAALDEYYDLVAYMLAVAPISAHKTLTPHLIKADQLRRAMTKLGREPSFFEPLLAVSHTTGPNEHGREQRACTGCGKCCTGCPERAKNTLDFNYLAVAEQHGAIVKTQVEVVDVEERGAGEWAAHCIDHLTAARREFRAKYLFLCAGSVHSTRLLFRARLNSRETDPKANVGAGYFPGGDALGVVYDTVNPQHPSFGPTITTTTVHVDRNDPGSFFLIQDGGYGKELERLIGMLRAPVWVGRNRVSVSEAKSRVDASALSAPTALLAGQRAPVLPSPVDAMVDAFTAGSFGDVVPVQLKNAYLPFLRELQKPLLFSSVVERTLQLSIERWHERFWLTRFCNPKGWWVRAWTRLEKRVVRFFYGTNDDLAHRAIRSMVSGAALSRGEWAEQVLGYDAVNAERRTMLLCMGRDAAPGVLLYDASRDRLIADLDLFHLAAGYAKEEQFMADVAAVLGGELRTNPAWAFLGKPITVHNQGGCAMSDDPAKGVTDPNGKVHGCDGLYVLDGAILCTSVGVNPSATIAAIAERNIAQFLRKFPLLPAAEDEHATHVRKAKEWRARLDGTWTLTPPSTAPFVDFTSRPLGFRFSEVMQGYYSPCVLDPEDHDAAYRAHETNGRPSYPIKLELEACTPNFARFIEDELHELEVRGKIRLRLPGAAVDTLSEWPVEGRIELFVPREKPYGIRPEDTQRREAHEFLTGHSYKTKLHPAVTMQQGGLVTPDRPPPRQRFLEYAMTFGSGEERWALTGYKRVQEDPGLDAWRETSALFVTLKGPGADTPSPALRRTTGDDASKIAGAGVVHVDLPGFLFDQLRSMEVGYVSNEGAARDFVPATDPALVTWAIAKFTAFFFGSLQRIHVPGVKTVLETAFGVNPSNVGHDVRPPPREP
jgi:choline dehydrogenase-like flavoprotein